MIVINSVDKRRLNDNLNRVKILKEEKEKKEEREKVNYYKLKRIDDSIRYSKVNRIMWL